MASADTSWRLRQWGFATLAAIAPFVAVSYDADTSPFAAIFFTLGAFVLVLGVLGRPRERRCELLLTTLILGTLFWAILGPVFRSARVASTLVRCLSPVKQQVNGTLMYAADHDDRFPLAATWHASSEPYVKAEFHCPLATSPWSYAMNSALSGKSFDDVDDPAAQVLLFEGDAALPNASGGREWLVFRHFERGTIGFADGQARLQNATQAAALQWK